MRPSRGRGETYKKWGVLKGLKTHFKEGDINKELIDKIVELSGKYCCWHQHFFIANLQVLLYQEIQI